MRFSKSLLNDKDMGQKVIRGSIDKSKLFLEEVFGLTFDGEDPNIIEISEDNEKFDFQVVFRLNGRIIKAILDFEKGEDDILSETLKIRESSEEDITIGSIDGFEDAVNAVMDVLENRYGIDFTPLNPGERDENIKSIKEDKQEQTWEVIFTSDDHEAEFKATYRHAYEGIPQFKLFQEKLHVVYLD